MNALNSSQPTNPYQPPAAVDGDLDLDSPTEIVFSTNTRLRRYAIDHYLLHWHSRRLLFSSLIMIAVSGFLIVGSTRFGVSAFIPTLLSAMIVSAAIYTCLVYRTRRRIAHRLREFGLASDEKVTLRSEPEQLLLFNTSGNYVWPNDQLRIHSTRRGFMVCPAPLLLIFIPRSELPSETFEQLLKVMRARTSPERVVEQ